ncbi:MAG: hypothetical protein RI897_2342, partial [Verrucomicrobiota bacterium]
KLPKTSPKPVTPKPTCVTYVLTQKCYLCLDCAPQPSALSPQPSALSPQRSALSALRFALCPPLSFQLSHLPAPGPPHAQTLGHSHPHPPYCALPHLAHHHLTQPHAHHHAAPRALAQYRAPGPPRHGSARAGSQRALPGPTPNPDLPQ